MPGPPTPETFQRVVHATPLPREIVMAWGASRQPEGLLNAQQKAHIVQLEATRRQPDGANQMWWKAERRADQPTAPSVRQFRVESIAPGDSTAESSDNETSYKQDENGRWIVDRNKLNENDQSPEQVQLIETAEVLEFSRIMRSNNPNAQKAGYKALQERYPRLKNTKFEDFKEQCYGRLMQDPVIARIIDEFPNVDQRQLIDMIITDNRFINGLNERLVKATDNLDKSKKMSSSEQSSTGLNDAQSNDMKEYEAMTKERTSLSVVDTSYQDLQKRITAIKTKYADKFDGLYSLYKSNLKNKPVTQEQTNEAVNVSIENVIGDCVSIVMEQKLDESMDAEQKLHAKEQGKTNEQRTINGAIETNWVSYNSATRERTIYGDRIVADLRILSIAGESGTRLLMARDLGIITDKDLGFLLDKNGRLSKDTKTKTAAQLQSEYIMSLLTRIDGSEKRDSVDIMVTKKGAEYRRKLMSSTMTMREYLGEGFAGLKIRLGEKIKFVGDRKILAYLTGGPMDANGQEWEMLCERYGGDLDQALQSNEKAKGIMDNLKEKGITPDSKIKYLLWFLLVVLGLGLGGVPGVVAGLGGLAAPGVAAAVGVGGTLGGGAVGKAVGQRLVQ